MYKMKSFKNIVFFLLFSSKLEILHVSVLHFLSKVLLDFFPQFR